MLGRGSGSFKQSPVAILFHLISCDGLRGVLPSLVHNLGFLDKDNIMAKMGQGIPAERGKGA